MYKLYIGRKYKRIRLDDGYVISSNIQRRQKEPHLVEITFDLKELLKSGDKDMVKSLIAYDTEFYLEQTDINIGYILRKKHNQQYLVQICQKQDTTNYLYPLGNETLQPGVSFFTGTNGTFPVSTTSTAGGNTSNVAAGKILARDGAFTSALTSYDEIDYIFTSSLTTSQNMVNLVKVEELSIAGQTLEDDILKITLFSGLNNINGAQHQSLVYGGLYPTSLSNFLSILLNNYIINLDSDYNINYTVEPKPNLEILEDILRNKTFRDGGFDLATGRQIIDIYDAQKLKPTIRATTSLSNQENPYIALVRENYPTLSAEMYMNNNYVREGDKIMMNYQNKHTSYRGEFIVYEIKQDLLYDKVLEKSTVQLLKTNRDVRVNYIKANLSKLSQQYI
jgi:hypothetical protein